MREYERKSGRLSSFIRMGERGTKKDKRGCLKLREKVR